MNPYGHSSEDKIEHLDFLVLEKVAKGIVVLSAVLAGQVKGLI
jgi:hypothetical protein